MTSPFPPRVSWPSSDGLPAIEVDTTLNHRIVIGSTQLRFTRDAAVEFRSRLTRAIEWLDLVEGVSPASIPGDTPLTKEAVLAVLDGLGDNEPCADCGRPEHEHDGGHVYEAVSHA